MTEIFLLTIIFLLWLKIKQQRKDINLLFEKCAKVFMVFDDRIEELKETKK